MSLFDIVANRVASTIQSRVPALASVQQSLGGALIGKLAPKGLVDPLNRAMRGDVVGAASDSLTGLLGDKMASAAGKNPLLGGITMAEAARIAAEVSSTKYSKKNLWFIEVSAAKTGGFEDIGHAFNLFATDVSYTGWSINSEGMPVGMAMLDKVTGSERVELRVTTMDDTKGTIKRWFDAKCAAVAHQDGTVGLPVDYLVSISITHAATDKIGGAIFGSFTNKYSMRPSSIEYDLSRSEDGLQQIQMVFTQFDTFM